MNTKQIISFYYDKVATKTSGDKVLNIFKAKNMGDLPKSLLDNYANPDCLCSYNPVRGLRYSTGNPDYGEWDAQVVLVRHGKIVDLYVCAILVRPFSEEAKRKYESMSGQLANRRVALMWDSREYDEIHGYDRCYVVVDDSKPKKRNKRFRPTLTQMRALQAENTRLETNISFAKSCCGEYEKTIDELRSTVAHDEELRKKAVETELKNVELSDRVKELTESNKVLTNSNTLMEQELRRLRNAYESLSKLNDDKSLKITMLESRGFWARLFNK